jgi:hypothetical protein
MLRWWRRLFGDLADSRRERKDMLFHATCGARWIGAPLRSVRVVCAHDSMHMYPWHWSFVPGSIKVRRE